MNVPRISIVGFGYVGLTTAVCFASRGLSVCGFDIDRVKVSKINNGVVPFHEPQVSDLLRSSLKAGFRASSDKIEPAEITFVTVGTPSYSDGSIDLSHIKSASEMIGKALKNSQEGRLVVVKSTVVPGTTEGIVRPIIESLSGKKVGKDIGLAVNPEFLREGSAVNDMFDPDRLVIGEYDNESGDMLESLYEAFYHDKMPPLLRTNMVNAEFIKYANNAFLATKISFANTIANIAQRVPSADVTIIAKGIGLDDRIGRRFLNAGLGFGGSCFPKDVNALIEFSRLRGYDPILLDDSNEVNKRQPLIALQLARTILGTLMGKKITILGLSFKPDTDDIREAVSLPIIRGIIEEGGKIVAYDPAAMENTSKVFGNKIDFGKTAINAIENAECCIIVTEWEEFRKLGPKDFNSKMKKSVIIDGRRVYDPLIFKDSVSKFVAIGLGN